MSNDNFIIYHDYLCDTIIDDLKTVHSFCDPSLSIKRIDHDISFRADISKDRIYEQAEYFSSRAATVLDPNCKTGRFLTDRNLDKVRKRLKNAYIYSMYKVVFFHLLYEKSNVSSLNMFDAGYLFCGHHALFHLLGLRHTTSLVSIEYSIIRKYVTGIGSDSVKSITSDALYTKFTQFTNRFDDPECELVLEELYLNYPSLFNVSKLSGAYPISGPCDPLGNMCVNSSGENLLISNSEARSDIPSMFWNSALGVTLTSGDIDFGSQSFYVNCGSARNTHIVPWEVQSITGLESTMSAYPFEINGSPGRPSGDDNPKIPDSDPKDIVGGSPGNGNTSSLKLKPKGGGSSGKGKKRGKNNSDDDIVSQVRTIINTKPKSGFNYVSKVANSGGILLSDALKLMLKPRNLETALGAIASYNNLRLTQEQLRAIQAEAKNEIYRKSEYESVETNTPFLRITNKKGKSESYSKTEGDLGFS